MPIYEYVCDDCGHELEALQGINDEVLTECPECSQATLRRKISAAAFRLKGGGWYETDFKKDNRRNIAGEGGGQSSSAGKATDNAKGKSGEDKKGGSDSSKKAAKAD